MSACETTHHSPLHWQEVPGAPPVSTELGRLDQLADGSATMVNLAPADDSSAAGGKSFPYLLLRSGDTVKAYVNRCAHFGVPLAAKQEQLRYKPHISISCNVHYARFRWNDGWCEFGDCQGDSLIPIPVSIDGQGVIRIAAEP